MLLSIAANWLDRKKEKNTKLSNNKYSVCCEDENTDASVHRSPRVEQRNIDTADDRKVAILNVSAVVFPCFFAIFNTAYWGFYLNKRFTGI